MLLEIKEHIGIIELLKLSNAAFFYWWLRQLRQAQLPHKPPNYEGMLSHVSICNLALMKYDQYMELHAKKMLDRGTEGTLISLWHGPIYGLKVLRKNIGGVDMDAPVKPEKATDAPPLPILMKK